jgi:hypothetical protein
MDSSWTTPLLLTGMQRAGTTLLEKMLGGHPAISVLSQPLPLLMIAVKREFLANRGIEDDLPLGHLFLEDRYRPDEFAAYVRAWRPDVSTLRGLFAAMDEYPGQYTRFTADQIERALATLGCECDLPATLGHLYAALGHRTTASIVGAKETLCEEYLAVLLEHGWRGLIILRDPRDVLASLNEGRGALHAGGPKPTLLNLRNWRKSVAVALALEGRPGFAWVRYEDLVSSPSAILDAIARTLGIGAFSWRPGDGVRDHGGQPWSGNSSHHDFHDVSQASVGMWRTVLPHDVGEYTEAACLPELKALGYPVDVALRDAPRILASFREPYAITRGSLAGYSEGPVNVASEIERLRRVHAPPDDESVRWFHAPRAHDVLRMAVSS